VAAMARLEKPKRVLSVAGLRAIRALAAVLRRQIGHFVQAWRHRHDMEVLASFDDHMLADIGLTRSDLRDAIAQPPWRDPTELLAERLQERQLGRATTIIRLTDRIFGSRGSVRTQDANQRATAVLNW
jgi:uncharacterized protein YjiS (DUF1127 family)